MSVYLYSGYLFEYGPLAVFLFFWIITAVIVYVSLRKLMNRVARILLSILLSFIFAVLLVANLYPLGLIILYLAYIIIYRFGKKKS
ncbi:MAG: hypothetical protein DRJ32_04195 [Thermoprotei archaeon]|nr:MAG: hypothetical protein DRJ32_04195 [Thermoprotei archaeon]